MAIIMPEMQIAAMKNDSSVPELGERSRLQALQTALGPLLQSAQMPSGEGAIAHAQGTAQICADLGLDEASQCAAWLATALWTCGDQLEAASNPLLQGKDPLAGQVVQLLKLHTATRDVGAAVARKSEARLIAQQIDTLRRMLLAMAPDIRVVLIRLAWRLQTLR
jgi:GTP pyrophosphokinase